MAKSRVFTVLNAIMGLLFLFAVIVQYNDPDPIRWMLIYGAAAAACFWAMRGTTPRWLPALVLVASGIWLASWIPRVLGKVGFSEMFQEAGMATMEIEEGREAIGLLLVAIWMVVLLVTSRRSRSALPAQPQI
jgi:hypothetical protein